jgi:hypothetical protein
MDLQLKPIQLNKPVQFHSPLQLNTAQLNPKLNSKVDLFLNQAAIRERHIADIKQIILDYFSPHKEEKYVLFRHSSLYFFVDGTLDTVKTTVDNFAESNYLRFDGEKVTRIDPEYYLGPVKPVQNVVESEQGWTWSSETTSTEYNNNNNNNNNNNGNNNNG